MASDDGPNFPDLQVTLSVECEEHELESGLRQLNPILREIVRTQLASRGEGAETTQRIRGKNPHFGRLTFSQRG